MLKPRILIVDDEEMVLNALERWFRAKGFQVDKAFDGVEAVEKCRATEFDVLTMDLEMPRMNGIDAIRNIHGFRPEVPIIVLTGYHHETPEALQCGALKVLCKPISLRTLEEEVRQALPPLPRPRTA